MTVLFVIGCIIGWVVLGVIGFRISNRFFRWDTVYDQEFFAVMFFIFGPVMVFSVIVVLAFVYLGTGIGPAYRKIMGLPQRGR